MLLCFTVVFYIIAFSSCEPLPPSCDSPVYCYGNLLHTVQMASIFNDSKTFVDMKMVHSQNETLQNFESLMQATQNNPTKDQIQQFVSTNFAEGDELDNYTLVDFNPQMKLLQEISNGTVRNFTQSLLQIWPELAKQVNPKIYDNIEQYSFIPVPNGFIVPGGRFKEYYYWDSYWVIDGLLICEMTETARGMIDNFITLVERFGFIPNGGRIYYLRRSQPPLLTSMAHIYYKSTQNTTWLRENINTLVKELSYWNNQTIEIKKGLKTYTLAHYDAESSGPRPESYREDTLTASYFSEDSQQQQVYIDLKSGAESGWDFSNRWIFDESGGNLANLSNIQTRRVIPVDLNAFLCGAYEDISRLYFNLGRYLDSQIWHLKYVRMREAVEAVFWDSKDGTWYDYDIKLNEHRRYFYPSNLAPLWSNCFHTSKGLDIGKSVLQYLRDESVLGYLGGIPASTDYTGEQWDFPNAWPPLQDIVIRGLRNTGYLPAIQEADILAKRWIDSNIIGFDENDAMFEKYDAVVPGRYGGGGEYQVQSGFGWTNGLAFRLINDYYTN